MNTRRIKSLLWLAGAGLFAASAGVGVIGLRQPVIPSNDLQNPSQAPNISDSRGPQVAVVPLSAYEKVWNRSLGKMEVKIAPVVKAPEREAPPPPSLPKMKLVGTMIEDGNSFAIIEAKRGQQALLSVGDTFNQEMQVLEIHPGKVLVLYRGQKITLESPEEKENGV